MERRILVGAAEPVLDMQQYRFWHITAIGQKITSNGSLPLWVVTYTPRTHNTVETRDTRPTRKFAHIVSFQAEFLNSFALEMLSRFPSNISRSDQYDAKSHVPKPGRQ